MTATILDCTLRDGGYVNNWEFGLETASAVLEGLYQSGIRYLEVGIMGAKAKPGQTKFADFASIAPLLVRRHPDCRYAVMITTENAEGFEPPEQNELTPDIIRLAYFKRDRKTALAAARRCQALGYQVFLQAMATFMYTDAELADMLHEVNELRPSAFYMVDSFSTMFPEDVRAMRDAVLTTLSPEIPFGFHAHNNMQMAFANVQEFLKTETERQLFVDASIFGMGRGAGNVPTELLMYYLNRQGAAYGTAAVLELYQRWLDPIYREYGWGYTLPYYLTAARRTNSAYGWYFMSHGVTDLTALDWALGQVPEDISFALKPAVADAILKEMETRG